MSKTKSISGLLLGVFFLGLVGHLNAADARYNQPLWKRKRNAAFFYFNPDYDSAFGVGRSLYQRGQNYSHELSQPFYQRGFVTWQNVGYSDPLYQLEKCVVLVGLESEPCLRFNYNLNYASPMYIGWVFAHGFTVGLAQLEVEKMLLNQGASWAEIRQFSSLVPQFKEVDVMGHLEGMRFWHELRQNWNFLDQHFHELPGPLAHDYASESTIQYSQVARNNEASLNRFYEQYLDPSDSKLSGFVSFLEGRYERLNFEQATVVDFLTHPTFKRVAKKLMDDYQRILDLAVQDKQ